MAVVVLEVDAEHLLKVVFSQFGGVGSLDSACCPMTGAQHGKTRLPAGVPPQGPGPGRGWKADCSGRQGPWDQRSVDLRLHDGRAWVEERPGGGSSSWVLRPDWTPRSASSASTSR